MDLRLFKPNFAKKGCSENRVDTMKLWNLSIFKIDTYLNWLKKTKSQFGQKWTYDSLDNWVRWTYDSLDLGPDGLTTLLFWRSEFTSELGMVKFSTALNIYAPERKTTWILAHRMHAMKVDNDSQI